MLGIQQVEDRPTFPLVSPREAGAIPEWFLIQSRPCAERNAKERLDAAGVPSYLPLISRRRAGGRGAFCALFPSYLFGFFPLADAGEVNSILALRQDTVGIGRVVRFGQNLARVPAEIIAQIVELETEPGLIDLDARAEQRIMAQVEHLRPGQELAVRHGPCAGLRGILAERRGEYRVLMLMGLLHVEVDVRDLSLA